MAINLHSDLGSKDNGRPLCQEKVVSIYEGLQTCGQKASRERILFVSKGYISAANNVCTLGIWTTKDYELHQEVSRRDYASR
jgi:hypothetical protein